jgi:ATPase subunit of ABC transporter with duplicated ATPase domains
LHAWNANATRAQRRWRLNYPRGGDEHFADHYRGRGVFSPLLLPDTMNNLPESIIQVRDLKAGYGEKVILQDINFQVRRGKCCNPG